MTRRLPPHLRSNKAALIARLPRGMRPRLTRAQIVDLALVHHVNHDAICAGAATPATMWKWAEGALTWSRVAELLGAGEDEMAQMLLTVEAVIERYKRTGRVGYSGPEMQAAAYGVQVLDALAEAVDAATVLRAVHWSAQQVAQMGGGGA